MFKFKLESDGDNKTDKDFNNWIPKTAAKLPRSTMAKIPEDDNGGLGDSTANYGEGQQLKTKKNRTINFQSRCSSLFSRIHWDGATFKSKNFHF